MKLTKLAAIALAALLVSAGAAAALPTQATDAGAENSQADDPDHAGAGHAADADKSAGDSDNETAPADANASRAPPTALPEQVPDHVSAVHDLIRQFLAGDLDGTLGDQVDDVAGGSDAGENHTEESAASGDDASTDSEE